MDSRDLRDLHPVLYLLALDFLQKCRDAGLHIVVTCTYRDNASQAADYAKGRTVPGHIVTDAKPGQSEHNFMQHGKRCAEAFDIVPVSDLHNHHGDWDGTEPSWQIVREVWLKMKPLNGYYLDWYGAKKDIHIRDLPHFCLKKLGEK